MEPPSFINELTDANSRFDRLELIGEGTYGEVYRGVNKLKNEIAIKVVSNLPNKYDEIQNEMAIFQKFSRHPNMVDYYGTYIYRNENGLPIQIWLVMEYCGGRSVSQLAKTTVYNGGKLSENVIKYILKETLNALKYLHANRIIHRDIKGPNILLTISGHVKLIDFGVSARLESTADRKHSSVGSPFWMAPEVIACEQQLDYSYDNRCDIWSLGITAIELADADPPLADEHPMRALFKIPRNPPPTVKIPKKWSEAFLNFIARAVTKDFEVRPSAETLMRDTFFEGVPSEETSIRKELMSIIHIINKRFTPNASAGGDQTLLNRQENAKRNLRVLEADDLAKLPRLTDHTILNYLSERYDADQIYTYIGEILIAINPFKDLQIYTEGATLLYKDVQKGSLPPHIFMVACTTHQAMIHKRRDQCCVISGESGSGKTVSANYLVTQLAAIGKSNGDEGVNINLVKKILQLNPLMEAFGNAQTVINQNSSRFGKFLELHFTDGGTLVGAKLSEYLLEKSRVVSQPRNERNFHILYYLIAGLDFHKKLQDFELNTSGRHRYLNTDELSLAVCACTSEMQVKFTRIQKCFEDLGFSAEEIQSIYCVLASIIHLGDVDFIVDDADSFEGEKAKVLNTQKLEVVSSLLCVDSAALNESLTTHSSVTRGETITHNNDVAQALDCRDATSKALYGRLFSWIVHKINTLLRAEDTSETLNRKIGILDIFGFENFSHNSFEQLCINIANEQMQFYYNEYVFVWELEEYAADGVKGINVEFKNNKPILDLFLQKPVGILALLDEESRFPKASDLTLVEKFQDNIQSEYMKTSQETSTFFTIYHYAGKVVYDATGFLEKNRDTLSIDILQLLRLSTDKTIATLFQSGQKTTGITTNEKLGATPFDETKNSGDSRFSSLATSRFQQTVAIHFRQSLRVLLSKVIRADPHFVRCIRPNTQNKPNLLDQDYVMTQLRYTGVIETTKIRKQGYSDRIPFKDFIRRYKFFLYYENEEPPETPEVCIALLRKANIDEEESWKIGRTKVFLKYWHLEALSKCKERYRSKIITIRKFMRNLFIKLQVRKARVRRNTAATKIRAAWLRYITRKKFLRRLHGVVDDTKELEKKNKKKSKEVDCNENTEKKNDVSSETESESKFSRVTNFSNEDSATNVVGANSEAGETTSTVVNRPHFRNMKRLIQGYEEENWSSDNGSDSPRELSNNYDLTGSENENATDREGQAALEETRSIILLSQIDLASKETYELLNRTSYPVILSMTTKSKESNTQKTKNQKLNHKDRVIAVVDGYGDPLKQKYRQARLHYAETAESEESDSKILQNPPMLGLVEKPPQKYIPMDSDSDRESRKSSRRGSSTGLKANDWFGGGGGKGKGGGGGGTGNFSASTGSHKNTSSRFNQNSNGNRKSSIGFSNGPEKRDARRPAYLSKSASSFAPNPSDRKNSGRQSFGMDLPGKLVPNNIYLAGQTYEERSRQFLLNSTPTKTSPPRDFFVKTSFTSGIADSSKKSQSFDDITKPSQIVSSDFAINSFDDTLDFSSSKRSTGGAPTVAPKPTNNRKPKYTPQQNNFAGTNIRWSPKSEKYTQINQPKNDWFSHKSKFNQSEPIIHEKRYGKKDVDPTELLRYERLSPKPGQIIDSELYRYDRWSPKKDTYNHKTDKRNKLESHIQSELYRDDTTPTTSSDIEQKPSTIYPSSLHQKVLQERQLIEARIREVQQRRKVEQKQQQARLVNQTHHTPVKFEMPYTPVSKFEEHKAFNYLMNDRTLPHKITSHINHGNKSNSNSPRNAYPKKSPVPPPTKPLKSNKNTQNKTNHNTKKTKNKVMNGGSDTQSSTYNTDSGSSVNVTFNNNERDSRTHDYRKGVKKKKKGFNYGFDQDDVLRSIKLNKTGRLQELLVK